MIQESLLPDTRAIPRGSVEYELRSKVLVRYKSLTGYVWQRQIADRAEAFRVFWEFVEKLRAEVRAVGSGAVVARGARA